MSLQIFFDRQDREILRMINEIIDNGPSCDLEHRIFNSSLHPHGVLNLTTTHAYRMAHAVINLLGSLSKASAPEDRLAALASLREEVLHSAQTTFRYNTGRVLIQIMKSIIRSRDDETEQLKLVHDFRMAASGNPRLVRKFLTRHYLMEMPEEWNQLTMDHHVHDANTKGRKNATFLIMDAWIKGIRYLTVVYYNYIDPDVARELLGAAKIMGIDVRIGIEFKACFRRRYVNFVWTPRGFSDSEAFLEFFASEPIVEFMREGRAATLWEQQQVLATLGCWNRRHSIELSREFHIDAPQLDEAEFMAFVDKGQTSLLHLAEFAHKNLLPALRARVEELEKRIDEVDADSAITIADEIHVLDMLTPTALLHRYLNPDKNPTLPSTQSPADDDRPPLLKIEAKDLLEKLASLRSGYRITLQLSGLSSEDVLVLLWKGQGFITHLELFNMKEWKEGRLADLEAINELQLALNHGGVMHLKRILRGMEQALELSDDEDADERRREILEITANIRSLQSLYLQTPLYSQIGSDSTSHLGNRYGMGLAVAETLPSNARKRLSHNKRISTFKLPLNVRLYYRDTYRDEHRSPGENSIVGFVRNTLGFRRFGMTQKREWRAELDKVSIANSGNVITMGGLNPDVDNGLTVTSETAPVKSKGPGRDYYNTAYSNFLKVLIGFIPSAASFLYTQDWWFLAWFGTFIWFGITGFRNVIQMLIAGSGISRGTMLRWKDHVSISRICDSLMYTGISVALLEVIVRVWLLEDLCGCTVTEQPVFVFTVLNMVNALYICAHNIYRGFPKEACFGNLFRSALAIPMSSMYDRMFFYALIFAGVADPSAYLVPAAAIVSKCASDTVACVIESVADRRNNYMLRKRDFSNRLRGLFDCYTRLELAFPDADILALLGRPKEFLKITSSTAEGTALQVESFINALDLMYFWYYQPCAQQTLMSRLRSMTQEERLVFSRFQSILHNVQEICQLFVDGMLGTNFSKALSFYLDNHDDYIGTITRLCEKIDKRKSR